MSHPGHDHPHAHGHGHGHSGNHGNPADLEAYLAKMESPERAEWQKPDEVVAALGLRAGQTVCDLGAGPGYFALRMARAVGDGGHVFAVDVEPRMLEVLRARVATAGARNVTPVLALPEDPLLPPGSCDLILMANVFHHFTDGEAYLRRVARALRAGGRLVDVDFHPHELPVGPSPAHKVPREELLRQAAAAGYRLVDELTFLPYQYFVVLAPG